MLSGEGSVVRNALLFQVSRPKTQTSSPKPYPLEEAGSLHLPAEVVVGRALLRRQSQLERPVPVLHLVATRVEKRPLAAEAAAALTAVERPAAAAAAAASLRRPLLHVVLLRRRRIQRRDLCDVDDRAGSRGGARDCSGPHAHTGSAAER